MARYYHAIEELPRSLPIFPLEGALLLPRGQLPLNVFEPRYITMVDTALAGRRLIGMIQPAHPAEEGAKPALAGVGCAGKLVSFQETEDGRYLISLSGVCRFRVALELDVPTPYRQVQPDFAPFAGDLAMPGEADLPRERLLEALKDYLAKRDLKADWSSVLSAPAETLVNALAMLCPFQPAEKQALLEAPGWHERVDTLIALLEFAGSETPSPASVN